MKFKTEKELCKPVVQWLRKQGWLVAQEVRVEPRTVDIAAVKGLRKLWAIEGKLANAQTLITQAQKWKAHSNLTSIVLPKPYSPDVEYVCASKELGYIVVDPAVEGAAGVTTILEPIYRDYRTEDLFEQIRLEHQEFLGAGAGAEPRLTDWNLLRQALGDYLQAHPGSTIEEAHDHLRDRSFSGRRNIIQRMEFEIKKHRIPGLYLAGGKVYGASDQQENQDCR